MPNREWLEQGAPRAGLGALERQFNAMDDTFGQEVPGDWRPGGTPVGTPAASTTRSPAPPVTDLAATHLAVCPYCKTVWELESIFPEQVKLMICWRCAEQYAGTELVSAPSERSAGQRPGFGRAARWMVGGAYALLATLGVALGYAAAHLWHESARSVPVASGQVSTLPAATGPAPAGAWDPVPFDPPSAGVATSRPAVPGPGAPAGAMAAGEGSEAVGSVAATPSALPAAAAPTTTVPAAAEPATTAQAPPVPATTVPAATTPATTAPPTTVPATAAPAEQPSAVGEVPAGAQGRGTDARVPAGRAAALLWGPEGVDAVREAGTTPGPVATRTPSRRPMLPAPTARGPSSPEVAAPTTAQAHGQDAPAAAARSGPACTQAAAALALCEPATTLGEGEP